MADRRHVPCEAIRQPAGFSIRDYRPGDAPFIAQLFYLSVRELGVRRYTPEQVAAWAPTPLDPAALHAKALDGRTTLVAVDASDRIVGWADMERDGHVDRLFRLPAFTGAGVAGALLDELVRRAACTGLPKLHTEASELARGVFSRKGFTLVRRRDFQRRGVWIHNYAMERPLA